LCRVNINCAGDPCIDGDLPRLMQTVQRWQEAHEDPLMVSEVDSCEFVSPKCVQMCLDMFIHVCVGYRASSSVPLTTTMDCNSVT
jgi:hypothetical protein